MKVNKYKESLVSCEYLRSILNYNSENGLFTWIKPRSRIQVGDTAGSTKATGYVGIQINGNIYMAHRLAWLYKHSEWPENSVDHINGVKDDNRFCNLRNATSSENQKNRGVRNHSTTGVTGVYLNKRTGQYYPYISINNKNFYPNCDGSFNDAARVRKEHEIKHYGDFRYQN